MPKLTLSCPTVDIDNPAQVGVVYQQFLDSGFNSTALSIQATQELGDRMTELYGTTDIATVVSMWQADPTLVPVDGSWGFSHAAQSLLLLQSSSNPTLDAQEQIEYWYVREAIARCNDGISDWLNPLLWSEDSRLDYWTPKAFIEWYLTQV